MYHIGRMQIIDAAKQIVKDYENVVVAKLLGLLLREDLLQVQLNIIYDHEDAVEGFQGLLALSLFVWNDDIMQFCGKHIVSHF